MGKSTKRIKAVWVCQETGKSSGIFTVNKVAIKELPEKKKYHSGLRKHTMHKAKEAK